MTVEIRVDLPAFKRQLDAIGAEQQKIVQAATRKAALTFRPSVVRNAPVLKRADRRKNNPRVAGTLARAIYLKRARDSKNGLEHYFIGVRQGKKAAKAKGGSRDAFYWRFLEGGWVARGPGKKIRGGTRRRALERSRLIASGAKEYRYPFLKPAFDANKDKALNVFYATIAEGIAKANQK